MHAETRRRKYMSYFKSIGYVLVRSMEEDPLAEDDRAPCAAYNSQVNIEVRLLPFCSTR